jgi:DNA-binding transcriptional ArsR family regulator
MSDADAGANGAVDAAALDVLGDETRVAILDALVEYRRERPDGDGLSFTALRERVGVRDSGRFNYHLGKLVDRFVEKGEAGYRLSYAGRKVAGAVLAGTYSASGSKGPTDVADCPCGEPATATYEDGVVEVTCAADHTCYRTGFPPGAAADRSMERLLSLSFRLIYRDLELAVEGVCPECLGEMIRSVEPAEAGEAGHARFAFEARCGRCGMRTTSTAGACVFTSPVFVTFCADHDADPRERAPWSFGALDESPTVVEEDPLRLRLALTLDDESFVATLDDRGRTVSTDRTPT